MTSFFGIYICLRVNATKLCITSVCVFISSWCMAWMLSIKYFVLLTQILRFFPKLTDTSPKWRHSLVFILRQVNATTVCITSVCVFFSFLCMAWMLSIKYFVIFTQISRFSLNWRAHLQNGVIFIIYFTPDQCR